MCVTAALSFLLVASLIKVSCLLAAPYYFVDALRNRRVRTVEYATILGLGAVTTVVAAWVLFARHLSEVHHNNDFILAANLPSEFSAALQVLKKIFTAWLPELYINYAEFAFLVVGVSALAKFGHRQVIRFASIYAMALMGFIYLQLPMFEIHDYYMLPSLPLLITLVVLGFDRLVRLSATRTWIGVLTLVLLIAVPIIGTFRALPRFSRATVREGLLLIDDHLDRVIPDRSALIIAASDRSPSIYLYFMHRKGWSTTEDVADEALLEMIDSGAEYLVSDSRKLEERSGIRRHLTMLSSFGDFNIFRTSRGLNAQTLSDLIDLER